MNQNSKLVQFVLFCLFQTFYLNNASAQNAPALSPLAEGLEFANNIKPTVPTQLVNPKAVNFSTWSSVNSSVTLPSKMGEFSTPSLSSSIANKSSQGALLAFGLNAQLECANYRPTGNTNADQYCAAVNFMSGSCIQPSAQQFEIIGSSNSFIKSNPKQNCIGTFGSGENSFDFSQAFSPLLGNSIMNNPTQNAPDATNNPYTSVCPEIVGDSSKVIQAIKPIPKYTTNTCWVSSKTDLQNCSQTLNVTVVQNWTSPLESSVCASGDLVGTNCVVEVKNTPSQALACPTGFTLSQDQCLQTIVIPANDSITCPQGGQWSSSEHQCIQIVATIIPATQAMNDCPVGTLFVSNNCVQTLSSSAIGGALSCPSTQSLIGSVCTTTNTVTSVAIKQLNCPANSLLNGTQCTQTVTNPATPTYYCPSGGVLNLQICSTQNMTPKIQQLSCNGLGTLTSYQPPGMPYQCYKVQSDLSCGFIAFIYGLTNVNTETSTGKSVCVVGPIWILGCPTNSVVTAGVCLQTVQSVASIGSYTCSAGTLSNANCLLTTTSSPQITYSCPSLNPLDIASGSTSSLIAQSGQFNCISTITTTVAATPSYTCAIGYTLNVDVCQIVVSKPASVTYSCASSGTLQGQSCVGQTNTITQALTTYQCSDSQVLVGTSCSTTSSIPANIKLSCPSGSSLSESNGLASSCVSLLQVPVQIFQYCTDASIPQSKGCVQYSVNSVWNDACLPLEKNSGVTLLL